VTKRKRDPNWKSSYQRSVEIQAAWYDSVLRTLRELTREYTAPQLQPIVEGWMWREPVPLPAWLAPAPRSDCAERVLQLDWVEAKVAS
jgi:hypothetical protein